MTAERQALRRLHDWAQERSPGCSFGGDHPIALARDMLERGEADAWPKARDVGRMDDMHERGHLRVGLDGDGDVYVSVWDGDQGASVEFCTPGSGGGRSSRTRLALIALMLAIEADNAEQPALDWWALRKAGK